MAGSGFPSIPMAAISRQATSSDWGNAMDDMIRDTIDEISEQGENLETLIAVGRTKEGKVSLVTLDGDRERLIVLLERAKNMLVRSMDP